MKPLDAATAGALADAVRRARETLRAAGNFDAAAFAAAYVAAGGPPGADADFRDRLLAAARGGRATDADPRLALELRRVQEEARWAQHAADPNCVGLFVELEAADAHPACRALLERDRGLGGGVLPPTEVVVLPPECGPWRCRAVSRHEVEQ